MRKCVFAFLCFILITGCTQDNKIPDQVTNPVSTSNPASINGDLLKGGVVDWIDCLKINGINYTLDQHNTSKGLDKTMLGKEYATIKKMHREVDEVLNDNEATFLGSGTVLYTVKGYKPEFRLAAYVDNQVLLYTSNNIKEELLGMNGKVESISFYDTSSLYIEFASIKDKKRVNHIANSFMNASNECNRPASKSCPIGFHLKDGTEIRINYFYDVGMIGDGLYVSKELNDEIVSLLVENSIINDNSSNSNSVIEWGGTKIK